MDATTLQKLALGLQTPLLVLIGLVFGWSIVSYAVMFRYTRRSQVLSKLVGWTAYCIIATLEIKDLTSLNGLARSLSQLDWSRILMHGLTFIGYIVVPVFLVYHRWVGHVPEPGYAHARDALLLRRPAPPVMADPTQGLFVPPASPPGHDETVDVRSFVRKLPAIIGLGVLLVIGFFLLTKLIFGFGPFF